MERAAQEAARPQDHDPARPRAHRARLSQRIGADWRRGWATSMCQTTAWNASTWAVSRSGLTVGMSTHASATGGGEAAVAAHDGPRSARPPPWRARARAPGLMLTFRTRSPPPHREHEHAVARAEAARLQPVGEGGFPHPSSLIRAVSSDTFVGGRVGLEASDLAEVVHRVGTRCPRCRRLRARRAGPAAVPRIDQQLNQSRDPRHDRCGRRPCAASVRYWGDEVHWGSFVPGEDCVDRAGQVGYPHVHLATLRCTGAR